MKLKELLLESSKYTKLRRYLWGKGNIKGLAILTPENPKGEEKSRQENNKLMKAGEEELKKEGYSYFKQEGVYGQREKSLIVLNISRQDAKKIGERWEQDSIIYIVPGDKASREKAIFEMLGTRQNSSIDEEMVVRNIFNLKKDAKMYSKIGRHKYEIPFFDDEEQSKAEQRISMKSKSGEKEADK